MDNNRISSKETAKALILFTAIMIAMASVGITAMAASSKSMASDATLVVVLLNQDPHPAKAGDTVEVWMRIQNPGGREAQGVVVEFEPQFPFGLVEGQSQDQEFSVLPNFPEEANFKTFKYTLKIDKDAVEGLHELKFKGRHQEMNPDSWIHYSFNLEVSTKEYAQIISVDKSKLTPGNETPFIFTIHNVGAAPLKNLIFSWEDPQGVVLPVKTDNSRYIRFLDVGKSSPQTFTVAANGNANPGLYKLNLRLQYDIIARNGSSQKETVETATGVLVGGQTDFDVAFSESSQGKTSLSISNIGANSASSVTISIPKQDGFSVEGSNSAIIGNLNKGDYTLASFQLIPKSLVQRAETSRAVTQHNEIQRSESLRTETQRIESQRNEAQRNEPRILKVHIEFTDTYGERQSVDKEAPIILNANYTGTGFGMRGQRSQSATDINQYIIYGVGILVLFGLAWAGYKKIAGSQLEKKEQ